jgi:hypothetical protein
MLHSCRQNANVHCCSSCPTLFILYFIQSNFRKIMICIRKQDNAADALAQKPRAENLSTSHPNPTSTDSEDLADKTQQVGYSTHLL